MKNKQQYDNKSKILDVKMREILNTDSFKEINNCITNLSQIHKEKKYYEENLITQYSKNSALNSKDNIPRTLMTMGQEVKRNSKAINKKYNLINYLN